MIMGGSWIKTRCQVQRRVSADESHGIESGSTKTSRPSKTTPRIYHFSQTCFSNMDSNMCSFQVVEFQNTFLPKLLKWFVFFVWTLHSASCASWFREKQRPIQTLVYMQKFFSPRNYSSLEFLKRQHYFCLMEEIRLTTWYVQNPPKYRDKLFYLPTGQPDVFHQQITTAPRHPCQMPWYFSQDEMRAL